MTAVRAAEPQTNALTVDVEDYFHAEAFAHLVTRDRWPELETRVEADMMKVLDMLEQNAVRATCFLLGWVADRYPDLVRRICDGGHELACHGYGHQMIGMIEPEAFREDVHRAKAALEDLSGASVTGYRAPTFSVTTDTLWAIDVLAEEGFLYDSSVFPIRHDRYGIPHACRFPHRIETDAGHSLVEFPLSTVRILGQNLPVAGGGYLRLLPAGIVSRAIASINRDGHPAIVYFHPWELDSGQPRLGLKGISKFRHYVNIEKMQAKLQRLLATHRFAPARDVLDSIPGLMPD